jgi:hypothetical protein
MKNLIAILTTLMCALLVCGLSSGPLIASKPARNVYVAPAAGNVPDGLYTITGESSHRCLEVGNNSCAAGFGVQIFDCDRNEISNNQKFNVTSDGSGNYTISPAHSDLCLEVSAEKFGDRTPIIQAECAAGKISQKWAMSQYGVNLEIRDVQNNRCLDIMRKQTGNYSPVNLQPCSNGTNQRWRLKQTTINTEQGIVCRASASHPEFDCEGTNDQQKQVHLGKTLTRSRCEDLCKVNRMVSCRWAGAK